MSNLYETERLTAEYLLFHYGQDHEVLPWQDGPVSGLHFPVRTVTELMPDFTPVRALDIGCATGRSAFELSRFCQDVLAIDYSHAFIRAARTIQEQGHLDYQISTEGGQTEKLTARLPAGVDPGRVRFQQGDAMHPAPDAGTFDLVHAANLVCRLTEPLRFLRSLPALVRPGGFLLLTTPCTWLADFTPPELWPQGSTLEWLQASLAPAFSLTQQKDLPFLIREHARKFQWSMALGTVWQRHGA